MTARPVRLAPIALAAALSGAAIASAPAAGRFDGNWSVVVITEHGSCDRAYRYPVRVVNGSIRYLNEAGVMIDGRVDGSGRIRATIRRGEQRADGVGRLSATSGAGTWEGKDRAAECSGRWEAERRDG